METIIIEKLTGFIEQHPFVAAVLAAMATMRLLFKPVVAMVRSTVAKTPWDWDDKLLAKVEAAPVWKTVFWVFDWLTSIKILKAFVLLGICFSLSGCIAGNTAVPSTRIQWNPVTGQCDIKAPKNSKLTNFTITRTGTNVMIHVDAAEFANDPNVVQQAYAGQAEMLKQAFTLGIQAGKEAMKSAGEIVNPVK